MTRLSFLILLLASLTVSGVGAQQATCSYDDCALRVKRAFWGPRLVQGLDEEKVAGFAFLAPPLTDLLQRSDSAVRYYSLFRARHNRGFWLTLGGALLFGGSLLAYEIDRDLEGVSIGLAIGGTTAWIAGLVNIGRAQEPLSKTVWWYNRSLTPSTP